MAGTGIVSTVTDKQGNKTAYGYDTRNGTLLQMTSDVDNISNTNTYGYTLGFLTKVSHNDFDITYDYDNRGRVSKIRVAGNDYLSFAYDDTTNSATASYCKKEDDSTVLFNTFRTVTDKNGNVTTVYYKENTTATEIPILENIYDTHGNLIAVNDKVNGTTIQYTLDKFGNTILQTDTQHSVNVQKENTFDAQNNNTATKYTIGADTQNYTYSYDVSKPNSVLNSVTLPTNAIQNIAYDNLERIKEIVLDTGTNKTTRLFHYLKNGDHTSNQVSSIWFGDNNKYLDNLKYKYDEKGNITEVYENSILVARYKYDSLSRIVREDNKPLNKTTTWEYDAGGNITNRFEYEFTTANDLNEKTPTIIPYSYATSGIRDRLMEYNGEQFEYDAIGNPITYRDKTFKWSHGRQLDEIGIGSGEQYTKQYAFKYNANGIRTEKENILNNIKTLFYLDGSNILTQKDTITVTKDNGEQEIVETKLHFMYGVDGLVGLTLTKAESTTNYYYKKNLQGDIIAILDNSLNVIAKYTYDAWGNHKISYLENGVFVDFDETNSYNESNTSLYIALKNPFRYRGYYYDTETGLYYLNSRYYDPETGRFINVDDIDVISDYKDILNGLNLFIYCNDNPVMFTDESGHGIWDWLLGIVIVIAAVALSVVTAGIGTAITGALGGGLFASVIGSAIGGAISGAILSAGISIASQGISNGFNNINWGEVGLSALAGGIAGAIFGAISGVVKFFATTIKLYRVTSHAEYQSIKSSGKFSSPIGTMEEKWFLTTKQNSLKWAKLFYQNGDFKIVKIRVPKSSLDKFYYNANIDGIGPGYSINVNILNQIVKSIRWIL